MNVRTRFLLFGLLACFVLTACGADDESAIPTATPIPPSPTEPPPPPDVTLNEVVWTTAVDDESGEPVDELTSLTNTADRVVAAVQAESLPEGTQLQAHWTIDGERLPELDPDPVVIEESRENAWIAWTLNWNVDGPWPIGSLGIVIEANGDVELTDDIFIVRPND